MGFYLVYTSASRYAHLGGRSPEQWVGPFPTREAAEAWNLRNPNTNARTSVREGPPPEGFDGDLRTHVIQFAETV